MLSLRELKTIYKETRGVWLDGLLEGTTVGSTEGEKVGACDGELVGIVEGVAERRGLSGEKRATSAAVADGRSSRACVTLFTKRSH